MAGVVEKTIRIITRDGKEYELRRNHVNKIKYIKNLSELYKTDTFGIELDSAVFQKVYEFLVTQDKVDLDVDIDHSYDIRELYFSPEDIGWFRNYHLQDVIDLSNAANYLEYVYLLELCCKKLSLLLLHSNGTKEFDLY
ncbi:hypothetical protein ECANGB1_2411 [Enterospora canceri]|uniref:SKP1 component POZ domain-containing protein n=1 Tax=Enterospora canceri TaxID=1081671 RepID=A0A1Y1S4R7_9MICR|nr:hypothetical protein ECANGB1_2411 [Enterospora canceri]